MCHQSPPPAPPAPMHPAHAIHPAHTLQPPHEISMHHPSPLPPPAAAPPMQPPHPVSMRHPSPPPQAPLSHAPGPFAPGPVPSSSVGEIIGRMGALMSNMRPVDQTGAPMLGGGPAAEIRTFFEDLNAKVQRHSVHGPPAHAPMQPAFAPPAQNTIHNAAPPAQNATHDAAPSSGQSSARDVTEIAIAKSNLMLSSAPCIAIPAAVADSSMASSTPALVITPQTEGNQSARSHQSIPEVPDEGLDASTTEVAVEVSDRPKSPQQRINALAGHCPDLEL